MHLLNSVTPLIFFKATTSCRISHFGFISGTMEKRLQFFSSFTLLNPSVVLRASFESINLPKDDAHRQKFKQKYS